MPLGFNDAHPKFRVAGWGELLGKDKCISAPEMARHFLATGETGSGKSVSAVMPLLESILRYPEDDLYRRYIKDAGDAAERQDDLRPSVLAVDPKEELGDVVRREARGRRVIRVTYGEPGAVLHLFEGRDLSKLEAHEALNLILQHSEFFVLDQARTREPVWNLQAASILRDFIAIDLWLHRKDGAQHDLWNHVRDVLASNREYRAFTGSLWYDRDNYFRPMSTLINLCSGEEDRYPLSVYLEATEALGVPGELTARLMSLNGLYHSTRSGVIWMVNGILADIASPEFAACVSVNPLEPPEQEKRLSVKDVLNKGDAVVYVPKSGSPIADMVGRCLKSKFFEFAFERENKVRPFFYVVDEAHRFLTAGSQDGEQGLLDRCRAYRAGVVLATQSIAAMANRLEQFQAGKSALAMMLNNCGNALYFRTPDIETQDHLMQRIPGAPVPNRPHVVKVRPLASLGVGQCYALRCNGTWGLFQVHLPDAASGCAQSALRRAV
jgi:hypothetical protein